jgi:anti-sigma factor RsiW
MSTEDGAELLSCRELVEFLADYLDGELAPALRERFEQHLRLCPPCVAYLDSYRETVRMAADAWGACGPEDPVPDEVPEELVRAVLAARPRR